MLLLLQLFLCAQNTGRDTSSRVHTDTILRAPWPPNSRNKIRSYVFVRESRDPSSCSPSPGELHQRSSAQVGAKPRLTTQKVAHFKTILLPGFVQCRVGSTHVYHALRHITPNIRQHQSNFTQVRQRICVCRIYETNDSSISEKACGELVPSARSILQGTHRGRLER